MKTLSRVGWLFQFPGIAGFIQRRQKEIALVFIILCFLFSTRGKLSVDWSKWMMMKRWKVDEQWESMVASYKYLEVSNPGLQMLGSNECDVSYQYGPRASFQYIRRIPALYILRPKKNLRQLESCQPSSQYKWSVDGWMCCQITTPGRSI